MGQGQKGVDLWLRPDRRRQPRLQVWPKPSDLAALDQRWSLQGQLPRGKEVAVSAFWLRLMR